MVNTVLVMLIPAMYLVHLMTVICCTAVCWSIASTVFKVDNCKFFCIVNTVLVVLIPAMCILHLMTVLSLDDWPLSLDS